MLTFYSLSILCVIDLLIGHDVFSVESEFPATTMSYLFKRFNFPQKVKLYCNVVAYSYAGVHRTVASDGFELDNDLPITGIVYDGNELVDVNYQSSSNTVSAMWHGFEDLGAGVLNYWWCAGNTTLVSDCGLTGGRWVKLGLHTSVIKQLRLSLPHDSMVYNKVYAEDGVGHQSDIIVSNGMKIDTTPPMSQQLVHEDENNLLANPSFELTSGSFISWNQLNETYACSLDASYSPSDWTISSGSCAVTVSSDTNFARDGRMMLLLRGEVSQTVSNLEINGLYRIRFYTSHLPVFQSAYANKEGYIEFIHRHVFMMYTKGYRNDEHDSSTTRDVLTWHLHTFYFTSKTNEHVLKLGELNKMTGMLIDGLELHHVTLKPNEGDHVTSHLVFMHDWGSIHGAWSFIEPESHIVECMWAIGYTRGGTQVQGFESVGKQNFAYNNNVTLVHESKVYITVVARNSAGLQGVAYSIPFLVDLTPPDISEVNDGTGEGGLEADLDSEALNEIAVNWKVSDPESDIEICEWAIGYQRFGNEIRPFTKVLANETKSVIENVNYTLLEGRTVYSSIRCQNGAGLLSSNSSDGIRISNTPPATDGVILMTIGQSVTQYTSEQGFQSYRSQIRFKWTGFHDTNSIKSYTFHDDQAGIPTMQILDRDQTYMFVRLDGLHTQDGMYNVSLTAKNHIKSSTPITNKYHVVSTPPSDTGMALIVSWNNNNQQVHVDWKSSFASDFSLRYEVSAGSTFGGGDVIQWRETKDTSIIFDLPKTIISPENLQLYVYVRAVAAGGLFIDKHASFTLPKNIE